MIKIVIKGEPPRATAQQKGERIIRAPNGPRIQHYTKANVKEAMAFYAQELIRHVPKKKMTGAVFLDVMFVFGSTSLPKNRWKITRPDTDNMVKALKDVMTKLGYWQDDSQVATEIVQKAWGKKPGVYICVEEMEPLKDCAELIGDHY